MKRIGYLFDDVLELDNLQLAFWKASRGKRWSDGQREYAADVDRNLVELRAGLETGEYLVGDYHRFTIYKMPRVDYREVLSPAAFATFARLREERKRLASAEKVPPYLVMTDAQLAAVATMTESSVEAMKAIEGVGDGRVEKYGEALLSVLLSVEDTLNETEQKRTEEESNRRS